MALTKEKMAARLKEGDHKRRHEVAMHILTHSTSHHADKKARGHEAAMAILQHQMELQQIAAQPVANAA